MREIVRGRERERERERENEEKEVREYFAPALIIFRCFVTIIKLIIIVAAVSSQRRKGSLLQVQRAFMNRRDLLGYLTCTDVS